MNVRQPGSEGADFVSAVAPPDRALPPNFADDAPVGLGLLDADAQWVYMNDLFLQVTGLERDEVLGRPLSETPFAADTATIRRILLDDDDDARGAVVDGSAGALGDAAAAGWHVTYRRLENQGRVVGVTAAVAGSAPEQLHQLDRARRRLAAQIAAAERIGTTLELDVTCEELAEFTIPALSDLTIVEVLPYEVADRGAGAGSVPPGLRRAAFACTPSIRRRLDSRDSVRSPGSHAPFDSFSSFESRTAMLGTPTRPGDGSAVARGLRAGAPVAANRLSAGELAALAGNDEDLAAFRLAGVESILTAPLVARGRVVGALTMARTGGKRGAFTEEDVVLVQDLADRAAVSVENARQYAESQRMTRDLQRALLVEPGPPHANLEIAARYLPVGGRNLVGGDWYEIVRLPFGRTLLVMADVMGHGMEAAVDMSNYRSIIRELGSMDIPPHGILSHLDAVIAANESARPATCLLAVADPNRGRWTLASAGHLPPALFAAGRPTTLIPTPVAPPLGTGIGGYAQVSVDLLPDQILLLYTDGLVERRGEDIDVSLARLASVVFPPTGELEQLLHVVLRSLASSASDDDIAVLAARAQPGRSTRA